ncbi:helix-turn-helix domain-containing protein [Paracoccus aminovorans]|uniref:helix-turn-helix domain-containing protein n=1 Tax=Paracoccus aminovorans TaxID=34004 RepID=UPI002B25A2DF|nr:XRE family transcriptional regulator [Paracoccus aminovorans]
MTSGADLRTLRKNRSLTLVQMAKAMGRSLGWMSQVERDVSRINSDDLQKLAQILDVAPSLLRQPQAEVPREEGRIVRAGRRRGVGHRADGLTEALISPDLTDSFEIVHSTFLPGHSLPEPVRRETQEIGFMLAGQLDLTFGDQAFTVGPGDSFRIRNEPYSWSNPYSETAVALWVISPPIY